MIFINIFIGFWAIERRARDRVVIMLPQGVKKTITDNPKKLANLIDLVNLPSTLREFVGQSRISRLGCFMHVWSYIKTNNLQVVHPLLPILCFSCCFFLLEVYVAIKAFCDHIHNSRIRSSSYKFNFNLEELKLFIVLLMLRS